MATKLMRVVLFAVLVSLPACGPMIRLSGSGNIVSKSHAIDGFTKIETSGTFRLTVVSGAEYKVEVRADDNVMPHIVLEKKGDTLEIGFGNKNHSLKNATLEVDVTMPKLTGIALSGISSAKISGFQSPDQFSADLSGVSSLSGVIDCGDATFDLSGSSKVTIAGSGQSLSVEASGASSATLSDFATIGAKIDASGSSSVFVSVSGKLDAEASGASKVIYWGNPTLGNIDSSGSASIRPN